MASLPLDANVATPDRDGHPDAVRGPRLSGTTRLSRTRHAPRRAARGGGLPEAAERLEGGVLDRRGQRRRVGDGLGEGAAAGPGRERDPAHLDDHPDHGPPVPGHVARPPAARPPPSRRAPRPSRRGPAGRSPRGRATSARTRRRRRACRRRPDRAARATARWSGRRPRPAVRGRPPPARGRCAMPSPSSLRGGPPADAPQRVGRPVAQHVEPGLAGEPVHAGRLAEPVAIFACSLFSPMPTLQSSPVAAQDPPLHVAGVRLGVVGHDAEERLVPAEHLDDRVRARAAPP